MNVGITNSLLHFYQHWGVSSTSPFFQRLKTFKDNKRQKRKKRKGGTGGGGGGGGGERGSKRRRQEWKKGSYARCPYRDPVFSGFGECNGRSCVDIFFFCFNFYLYSVLVLSLFEKQRRGWIWKKRKIYSHNLEGRREELAVCFFRGLYNNSEVKKYGVIANENKWENKWDPSSNHTIVPHPTKYCSY